MAKTEEKAVRNASNGKQRRKEVMGEKVMVEKVMVMVELVPNANHPGRVH